MAAESLSVVLVANTNGRLAIPALAGLLFHYVRQSGDTWRTKKSLSFPYDNQQIMFILVHDIKTINTKN